MPNVGGKKFRGKKAVKKAKAYAKRTGKKVKMTKRKY